MAHRELTAADYMAMFRRRWVLIVSLAVIGGPLAYAVAVLLPAKYQSQTLVLVESASISESYVKPLDTAGLGQQLASMQQEILSRSRLEPIIRKYNLYSHDMNHVSIDELVARLQKNIEVSPILPMLETHSQTLPGFNVTVTLDNPHTAQNVCAEITSMFIEESSTLIIGKGKDTIVFFAGQLKEAQAALDEQDAKLADFKAHHLGEMPEETQNSINLLNTLSSQLDASTQALSHVQQEKTYNEGMLASQLATLQAAQMGTGASPDTLDKQLAALQQTLLSLESRYTDDYPDVIKTKADIAALQKKIAEQGGSTAATTAKTTHPSVEPLQIQQLRAQGHALDQELADKEKQQQRIQQQINAQQARIEASPAAEEQFKEASRGYQVALDNFNDTKKKYDEAVRSVALHEQQQGEQFRVLDPANLPAKPSFPNRPLFALGGLGGGLGLGLALAFLLEMKDTSFKTERDVEFVLQLPVLAMVPAIEPPSAKGIGRTATVKNVEAGARA
jgi:polysaccharide chain length determinant protein (PEP-CTERM system associated)